MGDVYIFRWSKLGYLKVAGSSEWGLTKSNYVILKLHIIALHGYTTAFSKPYLLDLRSGFLVELFTSSPDLSWDTDCKIMTSSRYS